MEPSFAHAPDTFVAPNQRPQGKETLTQHLLGWPNVVTGLATVGNLVSYGRRLSRVDLTDVGFLANSVSYDRGLSFRRRIQTWCNRLQ